MFLKDACDIEFKVIINENEYDTFIFHTFEDARSFCSSYYYKDDKVKRLDLDVILRIYDKEDIVIESFYYMRRDWERDVEAARERIKNMPLKKEQTP